MMPVLRLVWWLAAWAALSFSLTAVADPPARVGRLSLAEGGVTFRINRQDAGSAATPNWPISRGAVLETDGNGRAEIQVGSSVFRLGGNTSVEFVSLDDARIDLQVDWGSLAMTVRDRKRANEIGIATPAGQVRLETPGRYRIDVDDRAGSILVSSREGRAHIYRSGGELMVPGGRQATVLGNGGWFLGDMRRDDFDAWADARDAAADASQARRYVSPEMTGYEDLDRYGNWGHVPDYGAVWYPRAVSADWAPYRDGRWAWVQPWGWTWVDAAPWGFAPFHYGRWLFLGGRWAWVPGSFVPQPVYAPALVAWIGDPGWNFSFGAGRVPAVGWFPLAPREVFIPAYRCSPAYVRRANINHVASPAIINQALVHPQSRIASANRAVPQAVTVVPAHLVQSGGAITAARLRQPERHEIARAPVSAKAPGASWLSPATPALKPRTEGTARLAVPLPRPASSQVTTGSSSLVAPGAARVQSQEVTDAPQNRILRREDRSVPASPAAPITRASPPSRPREIPAGQGPESRRQDFARAANTPPRGTPSESRHAVQAPAPTAIPGPAIHPAHRPDMARPAIAERPREPSVAARMQPPVPVVSAPAFPSPGAGAREPTARPASQIQRDEGRSGGHHDGRENPHARGKPPDAR